MRRILFVFDTTGSMSRWIDQVRQDVGVLATRVLDEDDQCVVGFLAYGDYGDGSNMIQDSTNPSFQYNRRLPDLDGPIPSLVFTDSGSDIEQWLASNRGTSGDDHPECIEYVLRYLRATHARAADAADDQLIIFWIGDAPPHEMGRYNNNPHELDWAAELDALTPLGITFYMARCGEDQNTARVWQRMADQSGGVQVTLNKIENLADTMIAVVKREAGGLDEFAQEVRERGADAEMEEILVDLGATCHD